MKDGQPEKAAVIYDELARQVSDPKARILSLFNAGVAYKEAGRCESALIRLRRLLESVSKAPSFKVRGLMEISCVYECLGDSEKSLLSLKDAEPLLLHLPLALRQMLYPARLSIAYAGAGNSQEAETYKFLVLERLTRFARHFSDEDSEGLSRTFYIMGRSYAKGKALSQPDFLRSFNYHQLYLLQAWFLTDTLWSKTAQKELGLLLDKLAAALANPKQRQKYKNILIQAINDARVLIKRENDKKLSDFYEKKAQPLLKLLSQPER